jgi:hypothetical protein
MVAGLYVGNTLAYGLHNAGTFMSENNGECTLRVLSGQGISICVRIYLAKRPPRHPRHPASVTAAVFLDWTLCARKGN